MNAVNYKKYLLATLVVVQGFNFTDRWALGLVLQDIKLDLTLTDTQLGVLTGIASAFFYAVMGIPIARWADRGNRVTIIGVMAALQSVMLALTGAVGNFLQLLLVRIGTSVGEAGCVPPAHSLIADHFARAERPRAMARYMMGAPLSVLLGFFLAGWVNQFYGWRVTFILLGLPGLAVALLAWVTLREPRRNQQPQMGAHPATDQVVVQTLGTAAPMQPSLREVAATLWNNATFRHLLLALSVVAFFFTGIWQWVPTFFIRSHGMATGELGTWLAVIHAGCGILGVYIGGELASRYAGGNERFQLKAMAIVMIGFAFIMPLAYLAPNPYVALSIMALANIPHAAIWGPLYATIQTLVPPGMRAIAVAIIFLFSNLIGAGLGPLALGAMSDGMHAMLGEESLRYALMALCPGYFWVGWHLWWGSRTVVRDLKDVQGAEDRSFSEEGVKPMAVT